MLNSEITAIKNDILSNNTYFDKGYANVIRDEKGVIRLANEPIFPMDSLGNYFYLRIPDNYTFSRSLTGTIDDCTVATDLVGDVVLVAYMKNANADVLFNNLVYTLQKRNTIGFKSGIVDADLVIMQELAKIDKGDIESALARLGPKATIVSITFSVRKPIINQCIVDPCTCS